MTVFSEGDRVRVMSTRHGPSLYNGETGTVGTVLTEHQLSELKSYRKDIALAEQALLVDLDLKGKRERLDPADLFGLPVVDSDLILLEDA